MRSALSFFTDQGALQKSYYLPAVTEVLIYELSPVLHDKFCISSMVSVSAKNVGTLLCLRRWCDKSLNMPPTLFFYGRAAAGFWRK